MNDKDFSSKKGVFAIDNTMIAVLVIIVIALVLGFIFKANILSYIRNLPGYTNPEDEEVDYSKLTEDELVERGIACDVVGKIDGKTGKIYIGNRQTNLIWMDEEKRIGFKHGRLKELRYLGDIVEENKINVKGGFFMPESILFYSSSGIPSLDDLYVIDGAVKIKGGNLLCKSKEKILTNKQERISLLVSSGKTEGFTFVFSHTEFLWFGSGDDSIFAYWDFVEGVPVLQLTVEKDEKGQIISILRSADDLNNIDEKTKKEVDEGDLFLIEKILSSKTPFEFTRTLDDIFVLKGDKGEDFSLEFKEKKYRNLDITMINNLFFKVDDVNDFEKGEIELGKFVVE